MILNNSQLNPKQQKILTLLKKMPERRDLEDLSLIKEEFEKFLFIQKLFSFLKEENRKIRFLQHLRYEFYQANQSIYHEDEFAKKFYIVIVGNAKVSVMTKDSDNISLEQRLTMEKNSIDQASITKPTFT